MSKKEIKETKVDLSAAIANKCAASVESAAIDMGVRAEKAIAGYLLEIKKLEDKVTLIREYQADMIEKVEDGEYKLASDVTNSLYTSETLSLQNLI